MNALTSSLHLLFLSLAINRQPLMWRNNRPVSLRLSIEFCSFCRAVDVKSELTIAWQVSLHETENGVISDVKYRSNPDQRRFWYCNYFRQVIPEVHVRYFSRYLR